MIIFNNSCSSVVEEAKYSESMIIVHHNFDEAVD